jgi:hypothetical protein
VCAVLSVSGPGSPEQAVLAVLLSLLFLKIYSWKLPYAKHSVNVLAEVGMYQIMLTFFAALCIQVSQESLFYFYYLSSE